MRTATGAKKHYIHTEFLINTIVDWSQLENTEYYHKLTLKNVDIWSHFQKRLVLNKFMFKYNVDSHIR